MGQLYDDSNYRAQPPEPEYRRPIRLENIFDPHRSVIDDSSTRAPMIANVASNFGLDVARNAAGAANWATKGKLGGGAAAALNGKGFTTFDRAQSAIGPVSNFLTAANPSNNPYDNNKYGQLAVDTAGEAVNYAKMRPTPFAIPAWAFSGSAEGYENENSARLNAGALTSFDPRMGSRDDVNRTAAIRILNGANSSWGRGSGYGLLPFNPYDRVQSAMRSRADKARAMIEAGPGEEGEEAYLANVQKELAFVANLINAAADEESARANPLSILTLGGPVARRQARDTLTGKAGQDRKSKDDHTIKLLLEAQAEEAEYAKYRGDGNVWAGF